MAKRESTFANMVVTLFLVAAAASFTLATVYNLTKEPIERAREATRQAAISLVLPDFDELRSLNVMPVTGSDSLGFNIAYKDGELVGIAIATYTRMGYSGDIRAMVGFTPEGTIIDVVHLSHAETPGLGDKIEKGKSSWSTDQFAGFDPREQSLKLKTDGGHIDGITAATITARAYCDAIDRAFQTLIANKESIINKEGE